jgi:quinol monooxygenase YgiN
MTSTNEPLPLFLAEASRNGQEISITGKWIPTPKSGLFSKSPASTEMHKVGEDIRALSQTDPGVLSIEINHAVGEDAVLVHQIFKDADAVVSYFSTTAAPLLASLLKVALPDMHLVRGIDLPAAAREAIAAIQPAAIFGQHLFGYAKEDYRRPDQARSINVTAKWTCKSGNSSSLDQLKYWWQRVGIDAYSMEAGLVRFEAYQVIGEDALIIHETFENNAELKFHLMKGTAKKYKEDIDQVAVPERYFFRGPVSWLIRTYSKVLRLPATYSIRASQHTRPGGSMSDGATTDS